MEDEKLNSFIQHYKAARRQQKAQKSALGGDGIFGFIMAIVLVSLTVSAGGLFF